MARPSRRTGKDLSALLRFERCRRGGPTSSMPSNVVEQLFEEDATLEPGEVDAETEVLGDAEREVRVRVAADVEVVRVRRTRASSRLADVYIIATFSPAAIGWSPMVVSSDAVRRK